MNRERLPAERQGLTHKFTIKDRADDGTVQEISGYLNVGFYPDGRVGEIFLKMDKQGGQVSGFADAFAIEFSMLLQSGWALEDLCRKFRGSSFPPAGRTSNPKIRQCRSPIDYVARYLEMKFVDPELVADDEEPEPVNGGAKPTECTECKSRGPFTLNDDGQWDCDRCAVSSEVSI